MKASLLLESTKSWKSQSHLDDNSDEQIEHNYSSILHESRYTSKLSGVFFSFINFIKVISEYNVWYRGISYTTALWLLHLCCSGEPSIILVTTWTGRWYSTNSYWIVVGICWSYSHLEQILGVQGGTVYQLIAIWCLFYHLVRVYHLLSTVPSSAEEVPWSVLGSTMAMVENESYRKGWNELQACW